MKNLTAPALLLVVLALSTAAPAMASPGAVVRDCADDGFIEIDRHSRTDLRQGKNAIPGDLDAYSDCESQIDEALAKSRDNGPSAGTSSAGDGFPGGAGGSGDGSGGDGAGGSGSGAGSTEKDQANEAAAERKRQVARADTESLLGDRKVNPGTAGAIEQSDTANGISLPLLLAIIALVLGLAAGAVVALRRRNPEMFAGLGSVSLRRRRR